MIIDTSFIIDLMDEEEEAVEKLAELEREDTLVSVTPVTAFELRYGALNYHNTEAEKKRIKGVLEEISVRRLPFGWSQGNRSAEMMHQLEQDGNTIQFEDVTIAALAIDTDQPIITGDPEHFKRINGVEVEGY